MSKIEQFAGKQIRVYPCAIDIRAICQEEAAKRDSQQNENAFCVVNLDEILSRHELWRREFPDVEAFFAVKSNTDPVLFSVLTDLGCSIDCASSAEIDRALQEGIHPSKIINSHPCNSRGSVKHAANHNISLIVFDSREELEFIAAEHEKASAILRISIDDALKFGCDYSEEIFLEARQMGVDIAGISFYVGPAKKATSDFVRGVALSAAAIRRGRQEGHSLGILNIGGSFPGASQSEPSFEEIARAINEEIRTQFGNEELRVIAEPGKFFSASPFILCTKIMLAKSVDGRRIAHSGNSPTGMMYYLNQGVYTSFICAAVTNKIPLQGGLSLFEKSSNELLPSVIWGPTCDGADLIQPHCLLPRLNSGDWLLFSERGAYSFALSTSFNGFQPPDFVYVASQEAWERLERVRIL